MQPRASRLRVAVLAALALGTVGVLGVALLPTSAAPGDKSTADTEFRIAGDGALPETAPPLREPHEPLSSAERGYALHLARTAMPADARDVLGNPGGELLNADLPPIAERTSARLVSVAVYDYTSDRLHQLLLDLTDQRVLSDRSARGLHLPPSAAESAIALELAMSADPAPAFLDEHLATTGNPLLDPEQVHAVVGVWRPVDEAAAETGPAAVCGRHRCVQLLVALPSGQYLGTQDFAVDLSARTVLPVGPAEQEHRHED